VKRLLGLIVLIALAVVAYNYWKKSNPATAQQAAQGVADEARGALDKVGDKFRETKTTGSVKAAFELNRDLSAAKIDVDADENGGVTLKGQVPSEQVRQTAAKVAAAVPDVKQVTNQLSVNASAPGAAAEGGRTVGESFDDKTVETKVKLAFSLNRALSGTDLKVQSYQRHLTLSGQVDGESQRQVALEVARQTPSVLDVTDQITVRAGGAAAPAGAAPAGDRVRRVEQALAANSSLAAYQIRVREEAGRILLSGRVKTAAEKDLAGVLAREAAASAVDNTLMVGP
jgi:hyperosmotically inducible periplasmic protein